MQVAKREIDGIVAKGRGGYERRTRWSTRKRTRKRRRVAEGDQ